MQQSAYLIHKVAQQGSLNRFWPPLAWTGCVACVAIRYSGSSWANQWQQQQQKQDSQLHNDQTQSQGDGDAEANVWGPHRLLGVFEETVLGVYLSQCLLRGGREQEFCRSGACGRGWHSGLEKKLWEALARSPKRSLDGFSRWIV